MIEVEKVGPSGLFTNYIYKAIPLAFDESMSYYETLCGLLDYMKNTMIPALNNNADAVIEVQNLMTQLQEFVENYFDNLDVQEEINNKLDSMVEDGSLATFLANYLPFVTPEMYGAIGDGETDDTIAIQTAINTAHSNHAKVYFMTKTYKITESLVVYSDLELDGNNAKLETDQDIKMITSNNLAVSNLNIHDLQIYGANDNTYTNNSGIYVTAFYSLFKNLKIFNCYNGIYMDVTGASGTLVENRYENIRISNYRFNGLFLGAGNNNKLTDGFINNIICNSASDSTEDLVSAIYIGSSAGYNINGVHIYGNNNYGIMLANSFYTNVSNIYIEKFLTNGIRIPASQIGVNLSNVFIKHVDTTNTGDAIYIAPSSYLPYNTHCGNLSNINISRGSSTSGKSINVTSNTANYNCTNIIIDGDTRTLDNDCVNINYTYQGIRKVNKYTLDLYENSTKLSKINTYQRTGTLNNITQFEINIPEISTNYEKLAINITGVGGKNNTQSGLFYKGTIYVVYNNGTYYAAINNDVNTLFSVTAPSVTNSSTNKITVTLAAASDVYFSLFYDMYHNAA